MGRRRARSKRGGVGNGVKRRKTSDSKKDLKDAKGKLTGEGTSKPEAAASNEGWIVHPLLIDHILENIFQHIISPKTDEDEESAESSASGAKIAKNVQNLRLVCKQWKETATRLYRRNRVPVMWFGMSRIGGRPYEFPDEKLQNFLDVMKNSNLIPIQRYTFLDKFFVMENQQLMKDFMRICGPHAVELDLRLLWDTSSRMMFTRRSFPDLNLMRLKTLTLECDAYRDGACAPHEFVCLMEALLSAAESLQEFQLCEFSSTNGQWSQRLIQRFGECVCKRLPKTVKVLHLYMSLKDVHLITLAESELKLQELGLYVQCGASSMAIRKFFDSQAATLKVLKIEGRVNEDGSLQSSESLDFPRFHELLHLELEDAMFNKFYWPDTFPKLISLDLARWEIESICMDLFNSAKKGLSLKEIHLSGHFPQAPLVKKAAQCFPNIRKVHISSSEDILATFKKVFVYFADIEELEVWGRLLNNQLDVDSVFSGVSEHDCRRIRKAGNFDNVNLSDVQHQPSLLNLMKLKKLVIRGKKVILTDFVAHFVLLKMASLNELQIHHRHRMSIKYVDLLREKLTLNLEEDDPVWDSDSDDDWQNPFDDSD